MKKISDLANAPTRKPAPWTTGRAVTSVITGLFGTERSFPGVGRPVQPLSRRDSEALHPSGRVGSRSPNTMADTHPCAVRRPTQTDPLGAVTSAQRGSSRSDGMGEEG